VHYQYGIVIRRPTFCGMKEEVPDACKGVSAVVGSADQAGQSACEAM